MRENHRMLDVRTIDFDTENPRIRMALTKYGDRLTSERIRFALKSMGAAPADAWSYESLRDSIRAMGGISVPITVVSRQSGYICVDGNTRLAIYTEFLERGARGNWKTIKAVVIDDANQRDIERIRVTAHLVGAREWPPYEKARYLHHLRYARVMDYGEMLQLCGGSRRDIERQIDAFHDLNAYYRDVAHDDTSPTDRYGAFRELQRPATKDAIFAAGLDLQDFGKWIRDGKIVRPDDIRKLPQVLSDPEAKAMFLEGGRRSVEDAIRLMEQRRANGQTETKTTLSNATLYQLAEVMGRRIDDLPYSEWRALKDQDNSGMRESLAILESLLAGLAGLVADVTER